jgi:hypothetical protein
MSLPHGLVFAASIPRRVPRNTEFSTAVHMVEVDVEDLGTRGRFAELPLGRWRD